MTRKPKKKEVSSKLDLWSELEINIVQCSDCKYVLVSNHIHDFVSCKCGSFTDGGNDYYRRGGTLNTLKVFRREENE